jgi:hypothetical protein
MIRFIPMLSGAKIIFDHVESLKPYGYLIGNRSKESTSLQIAKASFSPVICQQSICFCSCDDSSDIC